MYVNKCIKCGAEFETKNPKRVICPNCLYADKKSEGGESSENKSMASYSSEGYGQRQASFGGRDDGQRGGYSAGGYSSGGYQRREGGYSTGGYQRREGGYSSGGYNRDNRGGYSQRPQQSGYQRREGGYSQRPQQSGYQRREGGYSQRPQQSGYNRDNRGGGFQSRRSQGGGRFGGARKPQRPQKPAKPLLVTKEQLEVIEALYKTMLPLPNPDAHEVIGAKMELEPRKVFFGINLVRQKLMLPKLPYPKRKLAISEDQMLAIKSLYEPLLPLPPIGCHKIIATQLRMDEWRVHVGIGLIRSQMGLERWNQDREDAPEEYKNQKAEAEVVVEEEKPKKTRATKKKAEVEAEDVAEVVVEEKPKKTRATKKKAEAEAEEVAEVVVEEEKPKKTRATKKKAEVEAEDVAEVVVEEKPKKKTTRKTKKDEE